MTPADEIVLKSLSAPSVRALIHLLSLYSATELNHTLVTLLRDLRGRVDNEDTQRIDDALNEVRPLALGACSPTCNSARLTVGEHRQVAISFHKQPSKPKHLSGNALENSQMGIQAQDMAKHMSLDLSDRTRTLITSTRTCCALTSHERPAMLAKIRKFGG
jgi:hypothetical protein